VTANAPGELAEAPIPPSGHTFGPPSPQPVSEAASAIPGTRLRQFGSRRGGDPALPDNCCLFSHHRLRYDRRAASAMPVMTTANRAS